MTKPQPFPPSAQRGFPEVEFVLDDTRDWRDDARERLEDAREWVAENPYAALGLAVATGFLVGRVVRSR